jgi:hypothetical protein
VLAYCSRLIGAYERKKQRHRLFDYLFQGSTIACSGLAAVFAAAETLPAWARALPAALAGPVPAGMSGAFKFRENYLNFAVTKESLEAAKVRFEALSGGGEGPTKELEEFVSRVEALVLSELSELRVRALLKPSPGGSA